MWLQLIIMEKFIKTQGRDPFIKTENESAIAMFGHLNALVDAINELEQSGGGGGGGGNPVSIFSNLTQLSSAVQKITFTGAGVTTTLSAANQVLVSIPGFNTNLITVNSLDLSKLQTIPSQSLLGRYSTGTGNVQTITLGTGLNLSGTGVLTADAGSYIFNSPLSLTGNTVSLSNSGVTAGTYGQGSSLVDNVIPRITVDVFGRITGVTSQTIQKVALTTGTISTAPSTATDIVNKQYVDNLLQGLNPKESVKAATTGNINLVGSQTIDGVLVESGDRVLVKNQNSPAGNGIYVVGTVWARAADMNDWSEVPAAYVFVEQGTDNKDSGWVCTSDAGGTINSTAITWVRFTGTSVNSYTAGTGINIDVPSSTISIKNIAPALNTATTYGNATQVGQFTVDAQGRINSAANVTITGIDIANNTTGTLPVNRGGTSFSTYTAGNMLYANTATTFAKIAPGTNGDVLTWNGTTPSWQAAPTGFTNPMTTAGDIIYRSASATATRLGIGSEDQFLRVSSGVPVWETVSFLSNPMNSLGDMIVGGALGVPTVLEGATTNGHVLTWSAGGPQWQAATGGVTSVSAGTTGLTASPSTGAVVLSGTLNAANGGTGQAGGYVKGDILVATGANTLARLAVGSNGEVLKANPATTTGLEWGTGGTGMANPMTTIGDIIYASATGTPATPARLAANSTATQKFLRSLNGGVPTWEVVPIQNTVVSFVIDGYGGPLTGTTTTVFIATIPFAATYNSFSIQGDFPPSGSSGTNTVTLAVTGASTTMSTSITGTTSSANVTAPVINFPTSGTLTFTLTVTGPSVATTKLFVNLTGTRS